MTDDELVRLMRAAFPPTTEDEAPTDLWPSLVRRIEPRSTWMWIDLILAAAVAATTVIVPEWFSLLVYYF